MANTLTFANQTISDANIFGGINYLVDMNTGEEFTIGNTASASVSFLTDVQLPLYTKDQTNGTFVWEQDSVTRGRFYITEVTKAEGKYTVTAYDAMVLLNTNISSLSISFPATVSGLASVIATYLGCTVSGTVINDYCYVTELDADMTIRQLLSYIAEASGCSVKIDGSDHLCFMYYADSGITLTAADYVKLEVADYLCAPIDNVTIFNDAGDIQATAGIGGNSLYIGQNPFLNNATSTEASAILTVVSNYSYAPLKANLFDESGLEVGTIATFGSTPTLVMHLESGESGAVASSVGNDSRLEYNKSIVMLVNEAKAVSIDAQAMASAAVSSAEAAAAAAREADTAASAADTAAQNAQAAAESASADATAAMANATTAAVSANAALGQLSEVEKVVDVLNWASKHGQYDLTADTEVIQGKYYFTRSGSGTASDPYVYTVVAEPQSDPNAAGYYELTSVDEAISNYVSTHLALTADGLFLQTDGSGTKIQIAANAIYLYDENGAIIATYSDDITLGNALDTHITLSTAHGLGFYQGAEDPNDPSVNRVAYIDQNKLYITQAEITTSLRIGSFVWKVQSADRVSLVYSP